MAKVAKQTHQGRRRTYVRLGVGIAGVCALMLIVCALVFVQLDQTYGPSAGREAPTEETSYPEDFSYDRTAALAYAREHTSAYMGKQPTADFVAGKLGQGREAGFPNYGQNCANFVSQSLLAGGIPESGGWHAWSVDGQWNITETWRLANDQYLYFSNPANGFINGEVIDTHFTSFSVPDGMIDIPLGSLAAYATRLGIQEGDLIFFHGADGIVFHAAMISGVSESGLFYTANSTSQFQASVLAAMIRAEDVQGAYLVRLKDTSVEPTPPTPTETPAEEPSVPAENEDDVDNPGEASVRTIVHGWVI